MRFQLQWVSDPYSPISNSARDFLAFGKHHKKRITKNPLSELITILIHQTLILNNPNFNGQHFIETRGCSLFIHNHLHGRI